jgi:hypothetical protein
MIFLLFCAGAGFAEQAERPSCNAQNLGRFWPDQANWDHAAAHRAEYCGQLLIRTRGTWTHRWQPLTVHVKQLGKSRKRPIPGCDASDTATSDIPALDTLSSR